MSLDLHDPTDPTDPSVFTTGGQYAAPGLLTPSTFALCKVT
jgi:hypothetical protein